MNAIDNDLWNWIVTRYRGGGIYLSVSGNKDWVPEISMMLEENMIELTIKDSGANDIGDTNTYNVYELTPKGEEMKKFYKL